MACNTFKLSHEVALVFPDIDWRRDKILPPPRLRGPVDESNLCLALNDSSDYTPSSSGGGTNSQSELCLSWFHNPVVTSVVNGVTVACPTTHYLLQWSTNEDFSSGTIQERILANPPVFDYYYYCLTYPEEFRNDETIYWRVTAANINLVNQGAVSPPSEVRKLTLSCSGDENTEKSKYDIKDEILGCDTICLDDCCLFGFTGTFKTPKSPNPDAIEIHKTEWGVETCDGNTVVDVDNPQAQDDHVVLDMSSDNIPVNSGGPPQNEDTLLLTSITDTPQVIKVCVRKTYRYTDTSLGRSDFEITTCKKVLITQCGSKGGCTVKFEMPCKPIEANTCVTAVPVEYSDGRTLTLDSEGEVRDIVVCNCTESPLSCDCCGYGYALCWDTKESVLPDDLPEDYMLEEGEDEDTVQRHLVIQTGCNECCSLPLVADDEDDECSYIIPPPGVFKGVLVDDVDNGYGITVDEFQNTPVYIGCDPDRTYVPEDDLVFIPESALFNPFVVIEEGDTVFIRVTSACEVQLDLGCVLDGFETSTNEDTSLCIEPGEYCVEVIVTNGDTHTFEFEDEDFTYQFEDLDKFCEIKQGDKLFYYLDEGCNESIQKKCIFTSASPGSPDLTITAGCDVVKVLSVMFVGSTGTGSNTYVVEIITGIFAGKMIFITGISESFDVGQCVEFCVDDCCVATLEELCGNGLTNCKCYPGRLSQTVPPDATTAKVYLERSALTDEEKNCVPDPFEFEARWWSNACGLRDDRVQLCVHNCELYAYLSGINIWSSDIGDESAEDVNILGEKDKCIVHIETADCDEDGGSGSDGITNSLESPPQATFIPVEE